MRSLVVLFAVLALAICAEEHHGHDDAVTGAPSGNGTTGEGGFFSKVFTQVKNGAVNAGHKISEIFTGHKSENGTTSEGHLPPPPPNGTVPSH